MNKAILVSSYGTAGSGKDRFSFMRGSILPVTIPPPGTPPGKLGPSGPGVGNFLKQSCPGVGGGANRNNYSRKDLWGDNGGQGHVFRWQVH